ncbi:hypothetical protein F4778DRAFT_758485 [Xylariomycetidae sp. FL2044]|nr:hypothetical protein F4778DRAFT_758485 [Xylariomycetidae sp. FL2044]
MDHYAAPYHYSDTEPQGVKYAGVSFADTSRPGHSDTGKEVDRDTSKLLDSYQLLHGYYGDARKANQTGQLDTSKEVDRDTAKAALVREPFDPYQELHGFYGADSQVFQSCPAPVPALTEATTWSPPPSESFRGTDPSRPNDLSETHSGFGSVAPQSRPRSTTSSAYPYSQYESRQPSPGSNLHEEEYPLATAPGRSGPASSEYSHGKEGRIPGRRTIAWWKRKRIWLTAFVAILGVIAMVTGLAVGLGTSSQKKSAANSSGDGAVSVCRESTCNQILSAVSFNDELHVFAVGGEKAMWSKVHDGSSWADDWTNLDGRFGGQPAAVAWNDNTRITVFGLEESGTVTRKEFQNGSWGGQWNPMRNVGSSAIGACHVDTDGIDRPDVWVRNANGSNNLIHDFYARDRGVYSDEDAAWELGAGGNSWSSPAAVCRDSATYHNLFIYDENQRSVQHNYFSGEKLWSGWDDRGGAFQGDPVAVAMSNARVDFFGLGEDGDLYWFAWSSGQYSPLQSLGGKFLSIPSVVATNQDRIDVVAVGSDDRLKHRSLKGSSWAPAWDDLGMWANSAPLIVQHGSQPSRIGLFVLGEDRDLMYAAWEITDDLSWSNMSALESIGGNFTTEGWKTT